MQPVKSSQIHSIGYDAANKHMDVKFHGRNGGPMSTYRYHGVTPEAHQALMAAESIGSHLGKHIKGKHDFKKLPEEPKAKG